MITYLLIKISPLKLEFRVILSDPVTARTAEPLLLQKLKSPFTKVISGLASVTKPVGGKLHGVPMPQVRDWSAPFAMAATRAFSDEGVDHAPVNWGLLPVGPELTIAGGGMGVLLLLGPPV